MSVRDDVLAANARYAEGFRLGRLPAPPARHVVVVTCMDARIDPLECLGLDLGDAHVLRNAGAVVTDDVLRSLAVSHALMGTKEALVVGHTACGIQRFTDGEIRARVAGTGADPGATEFLAFDDLEGSVRAGVRRIRESPLLPASFDAWGLVYDVATGRLHAVDGE